MKNIKYRGKMKEEILNWHRLTNKITESWIESYFELSEEECGSGLDYDWINDEVGTVFQFADYFFNFNDILTCYKLNITREQLFNWYDFCLSNHSVNISLAKYIISPEEKDKKEKEHLQELKQRVIFAEEAFKNALLEYEK